MKKMGNGSSENSNPSNDADDPIKQNSLRNISIDDQTINFDYSNQNSNSFSKHSFLFASTPSIKEPKIERIPRLPSPSVCCKIYDCLSTKLQGIMIISTTAGGTVDGLRYIAESSREFHWITIVIAHHQSDWNCLRNSMATHGPRTGYELILTNPDNYNDRLDEIRTVQQWCKYKYPSHLPMVLLGHGMGAATALIHGGAENYLGISTETHSLFDAYLVISPPGPGTIFPIQAWDRFRASVLVLTGTKDNEIRLPWTNRLQVYAGMPPGSISRDKWLAIIEGATHINFIGKGLFIKRIQLLITQLIQYYLHCVITGFPTLLMEDSMNESTMNSSMIPSNQRKSLRFSRSLSNASNLGRRRSTSSATSPSPSFSTTSSPPPPYSSVSKSSHPKEQSNIRKSISSLNDNENSIHLNTTESSTSTTIDMTTKEKERSLNDIQEREKKHREKKEKEKQEYINNIEHDIWNTFDLDSIEFNENEEEMNLNQMNQIQEIKSNEQENNFPTSSSSLLHNFPTHTSSSSSSSTTLFRINDDDSISFEHFTLDYFQSHPGLKLELK